MTLQKKEHTENWKRRHLIALSGELALEEAMDQSSDKTMWWWRWWWWRFWVVDRYADNQGGTDHDHIISNSSPKIILTWQVT